MALGGVGGFLNVITCLFRFSLISWGNVKRSITQSPNSTKWSLVMNVQFNWFNDNLESVAMTHIPVPEFSPKYRMACANHKCKVFGYYFSRKVANAMCRFL